MSKQIVSRKPDAPYGWEPREMIFSDDLSLKAKGLWLYINTKPVGWEFSSVRIAKEIQEGERSIRHTLQELIDKGYLVRHKLADGAVVRIKEVKVGDCILKNIEASVIKNQKAPLLLGQSVLERFGSITIDNQNNKLIIKH